MKKGTVLLTNIIVQRNWMQKKQRDKQIIFVYLAVNQYVKSKILS